MRIRRLTLPSASGKHLKQTEIDLRKLAKRMHDIGESLGLRRPSPGAQGGATKSSSSAPNCWPECADRKAEPKEKS